MSVGVNAGPVRRKLGRTGLGHAEDILQDKLGINRMEAFVLIRDRAEREGRTLIEVADEVICRRRLPEAT